MKDIDFDTSLSPKLCMPLTKSFASYVLSPILFLGMGKFKKLENKPSASCALSEHILWF